MRMKNLGRSARSKGGDKAVIIPTDIQRHYRV